MQRLSLSIPLGPCSAILIVTASQASLPERLVRADRNNIYPRVGFAWRPHGTDKFVIRGGYGIYIVPEFSTGTNTGGSNQLQWLGPFALNATYNNVDNSDPSRGAHRASMAGRDSQQ